MVRFDTPGGIYVDALPSGLFACVLPGQHALATHVGLIPLPPELPHDDGPRAMFTRIGTNPFRIAVKAHDTGLVWVWQEGVGWVCLSQVSHGTQGHAWAPDGTLALLPGVPNQDSQGLRYYDPAAGPDSSADVTGTTPGWVTGSPTYGPQSAFARRVGVAHLYEWTHVGDGIVIGQGAEGGCVVQHPTLGLRLLAPDAARFIQAHRHGDEIAVAFSVLSLDPAQQRGACVWFTVAEIADLRKYVPPGLPPPDDDDDDHDEEPPVFQPTAPVLLGIVSNLAERYPREFAEAHTGGPHTERFIRRLAWELWKVNPKFGLNGKRGDPNDLSDDAIAYVSPASPAGGVEIIDVIASAGSTDPNDPPRPDWNDVTQATIDAGTIGRWVAPAMPDWDVEQPPDDDDDQDPPQTPPDETPLDVVEALGALGAVVHELVGVCLDTRSRLDVLTAKVQELADRPAGDWSAAVEELKRFHQLEERPQLEAAFVRAAKTIKPKLW